MKNTLRRFLRNKRAITPVLSELLLTVIAVAAMSVATSATYVITTNMRGNMSERVVAEDVWFNDITNHTDVCLFNVGKVDVSIANVYINHTGVAVSFYLGLGEHKTLSIPYNWTSGDLCYIDIVTTRGLHIADYYKAN